MDGSPNKREHLDMIRVQSREAMDKACDRTSRKNAARTSSPTMATILSNRQTSPSGRGRHGQSSDASGWQTPFPFFPSTPQKQSFAPSCKSLFKEKNPPV
jgi:hypothetical protein